VRRYMKLLLAAPRGYCAGVDRAIQVVEKALEVYGKPVYVRHQIVHNEHVINALEQKGAVFVEEISEIPEGSLAIFSAHGIPPSVRVEAKERKLQTIDATCPLVTKVHFEAERYHKEGYTIVLIGHKEHQEVTGTMGHAPMHLIEHVEDVEKLPSFDKVMCLTQTTLSVDDTKEIMDALKQKFAHIKFPPIEDICYATTNRQEAVKAIAKEAELVLIIGGKLSSNSKRLVETAVYAGAQSYLIQTKKDIKEEWLEDVKAIGLSSGASTPDVLVEGVVAYLKEKCNASVEFVEVAKEDMVFRMPNELST